MSKDKENPYNMQNMGALADQMIEVVKDIARIVRAYYVALKKEGFSESEAMCLTTSYQNHLGRGQAIDE